MLCNHSDHKILTLMHMDMHMLGTILLHTSSVLYWGCTRYYCILCVHKVVLPTSFYMIHVQVIILRLAIFPFNSLGCQTAIYPGVEGTTAAILASQPFAGPRLHLIAPTPTNITMVPQ